MAARTWGDAVVVCILQEEYSCSPAGADGTAGAREGLHAEAEARAIPLAAVAGLQAAHFDDLFATKKTKRRTEDGGQRKEETLSLSQDLSRAYCDTRGYGEVRMQRPSRVSSSEEFSRIRPRRPTEILPYTTQDNTLPWLIFKARSLRNE